MENNNSISAALTTNFIGFTSAAACSADVGFSSGRLQLNSNEKI
jgi:hypothetical protein